MRGYLSFAYIGIFATDAAAADYTEVHNSPFGAEKQEDCRVCGVAYILCLSGNNGFWNPVPAAVPVAWKYADDIYDQHRYQKKQHKKMMHLYPSHLYGLDAGGGHCGAGKQHLHDFSYGGIP